MKRYGDFTLNTRDWTREFKVAFAALFSSKQTASVHPLGYLARVSIGMQTGLHVCHGLSLAIGTMEHPCLFQQTLEQVLSRK